MPAGRSGLKVANGTLGWTGHLRLDYRHDDGRTTALDRHHGPLRVLQRLYPEGPAICHHVLVHPPGGVVGGDVLALDATLAAGSHALITTPGATRFYRSAGGLAQQRVTAQIGPGARLEWLPMEAIAYRRCRAENQLSFQLEAGAQMIGWDLLALGLPAAAELFDAGQFQQQLSLQAPGRTRWLERGRIDGQDRELLDGPLGLAGQSVLGTMWLADGQAIAREQCEALLDAARALLQASPLAASAGVTALQPGLLVLRVLAPRVEPAMQLLQAVWAAWRQRHWGLAPVPPRLWRT